MIAPMKKVWLLVLDRERRAALAALRALGVVHVETLEGKGVEHELLVHRLNEAERAIGILSTIKKGSDAKGKDRKKGRDAIYGTLESTEKIRQFHEESAALLKEFERIQSWGDFDPESIRSLGDYGFEVKVYECPVQRLEALPANLPYVKLASPKGKVRFALVNRTASDSVIAADSTRIPADIEEFVVPAHRVSWIQGRMKVIAEDIIAEKGKLESFAGNLSCTEYEKTCIQSALRFETLRSGMQNTDEVSYLSGYVPVSKQDLLVTEARKNGWGIATDEPSAEELPPTKVENSALVRIINPVFEFLGTVPNYREYDISAWFLGFFSLYFAMIFGDGGYGCILLVAAIWSVIKIKAKSKTATIPDAIRLLLLLALMTLAWGTATATWFAIPADRLPGFLLSLAIPAIRNGNPDADTNIKIFCFIIGAAQLAIAHIKNIMRDLPDLKFLAQVGSLMMVIGMFTAVLNLVIDPARFPIPGWAIYFIGIGFFLVFVFGNWDGNLLSSMGAGFKGIIPTFLGMVSVFADIVSYIRLWAVGLAGLAISQTVNGMASGMFGDATGQIVAFIVGAVMGVILLTVGHALNLVMSVLSVVVHGIRLNMLEFSGHLGMEWSGYKYDPLRETESGSDE